MITDGGFRIHQLNAASELVGPPLFELADTTQMAQGMVASPDGKVVMFLADMERSGRLDVYRLNLDDLSVARFPGAFAGYAAMAFSPDGRYVTLASQAGFNLQTGEPSHNRLMEYEVATLRPTWTGAAPNEPFSDVDEKVERIGKSQRVLFAAATNSAREKALYLVDLKTDQRDSTLSDVGIRTALTNWDVSRDGSTLGFWRGGSLWLRSLLPENAGAPPMASYLPERPWVSSPQGWGYLGVSSAGVVFDESDRGNVRWFDAKSSQLTQVLPALSRNGYRAPVIAPQPNGLVIQRADYNSYYAMHLLAFDEKGAMRAFNQGSAISYYVTPDDRYAIWRHVDGHTVVNLMTGAVNTLRSSMAGEEVPWNLLNYSSKVGYDGRRIAFRSGSGVRVVDLQAGRMTADVAIEDGYAYVSGFAPDFSFAVICHPYQKERAAYQRLDLASGKLTKVADQVLEARSCDDAILSPCGRFLLFTDRQKSQRSLVKTDGSSAAVPLEGDLLYPSFDAAGHYIVAREGYYGPLVLWSTKTPERGSQRLTTRNFDLVDSVTWVD